MNHSVLMGLVLVGSVVAVFAEAQTIQLKNGAVACVDKKSLIGYRGYVTSAPDFANDLIERAVCYRVENNTVSVPLGRASDGVQQLKLLSGHKVWVSQDDLLGQVQ